MKKYEITYNCIEEGKEAFGSCLCDERNKDEELSRIKAEGATDIKVNIMV